MDDSDQFIDGIFNYCDRWCERCHMTARCRLFAIEQEAFDDEESRDPRNEKFWKTLHGVFARTKEMLTEMAREQGIDLDQALSDFDAEAWERDEGECDRQVRRHPVVRSADAYPELINGWFEQNEPLFAEKQEELNRQLLIDLENCDPEEEALQIADAADVLRWYQYQIVVKLTRALTPEPFDDNDELLAECAARDADGSAKVALIGIDRSLAAWTVLSRSFPEQTDRILDIQVHLDRLRQSVEQTFPNARAFVRPGFDD